MICLLTYLSIGLYNLFCLFMPNFSQRSKEKELMDDFELANDALIKNLKELAFINHWLGGNQVLLKGLNTLHKEGKLQKEETYTVADLGSGGGDMLKVMAKWARKKQIKLDLIGIDANKCMLEYAQENCKNYPEIRFAYQNIFSREFQEQKFDIITCSLFCHHFTDAELSLIFNKAQKQSNIALIINDLHRHWFAYYSIKYLTRILRGSYLVKNDAPLSVLRAFKKKELSQLLTQVPISKFKIQWIWAFRYLVICDFTQENN